MIFLIKFFFGVLREARGVPSPTQYTIEDVLSSSHYHELLLKCLKRMMWLLIKFVASDSYIDKDVWNF